MTATLTCAQLLKTHTTAWKSATVHPFLQACQQGSITPQQFDTWLVQDYLFVLEFTRMAARLLAIAPIDHFDTLLGGMVALKDELLWFQSQATARSLNLSVARQPTCQTYCEFMASLVDQPYVVQATAFWSIELAYNQGWQRHSPMPEPYAEFADRWGNPGFTDYVKLLESQANSALADASAAEQETAEQSFVRVAELEKDFWQMAYEGKLG
ncbi:MAG: TenA family transcriptional regulator [Cyanobacteria bacterium J06648_16]